MWDFVEDLEPDSRFPRRKKAQRSGEGDSIHYESALCRRPPVSSGQTRSFARAQQWKERA